MQHFSWLEDIDGDSDQYGKQSKFIAKLLQANFPLVPGFVITNEAYVAFLRENNLEYKIRQLLSTISIDRSDSLMQGEFHIKNLFKQAILSEDFLDTLLYMSLELGDDVAVELYQTGPLEKQQKKISSIGVHELGEEIKNIWSEMFSSDALWKRHQVNADHFISGAEIIVTEIIMGDKNGVVTTIDPDNHEKSTLIISCSYPHEYDRYVLSKKNLTIIDRKLKYTTNVHKLTKNEIETIGEIAKRIEQHLYFPQEISWVFDGPELLLTDIKPVTTLSKQKKTAATKLPTARGKGVTTRIGTGQIRILRGDDTQKVTMHDIVIVSHLPADKVKYFKSVRGIIIESPVLPHETISLLKQFGIPSISNVKNASGKFRNGNIVTIHSAKGEIYNGGLH